MRVLLANPRGFCAGVDRAIEIVERALKKNDGPVYVRHEIVHNRHVVDNLQKKGARFVDDPTDAPINAPLIYSAHGVSPAIRQAAADRNLNVTDATCPLVTKVHREVERMQRDGYELIMIGHAGHVEVEGTMGHAPGAMHLVENVDDVKNLDVKNPSKLGCVTQTTLSVDDTREIMDALKARFPKVRLPRQDDICYATQNRQNAVKELAAVSNLVLIVGAPSSSNSNRLVEVAAKRGAQSYLISSAQDIQAEWLNGVECVGVSAGASTPEVLVEEVVDTLTKLAGDGTVCDALPEVDEGMHFKLPKELRD
ncbi:MAG: 4-hydroxy-3-methylbut-2-enyl diphosphate reductase [Deltaproteobacteria bacterium]|nr:4-hydroxy-3-methylbut-2-enyl diphosphate reductase [Deltaproteobacteria bacterium]